MGEGERSDTSKKSIMKTQGEIRGTYLNEYPSSLNIFCFEHLVNLVIGPSYVIRLSPLPHPVSLSEKTSS